MLRMLSILFIAAWLAAFSSAFAEIADPCAGLDKKSAVYFRCLEKKPKESRTTDEEIALMLRSFDKDKPKRALEDKERYASVPGPTLPPPLTPEPRDPTSFQKCEAICRMDKNLCLQKPRGRGCHQDYEACVRTCN